MLPAPVRTLVWWPPIALLLVAIVPQAAPWGVPVAGVALTVLATATTTIGRVRARIHAPSVGSPPIESPAAASTPVEPLPTAAPADADPMAA